MQAEEPTENLHCSGVTERGLRNPDAVEAGCEREREASCLGHCEHPLSSAVIESVLVVLPREVGIGTDARLGV